MKVFVAGATGVVGWRAVRELVAAGHDVTGLARTADKSALLEGLGAVPATFEILDRDSVLTHVSGYDAVINLLTHIPRVSKALLPGVWKENDRLRTVASANLAAASNGHMIQESITFTYSDGGDGWLTEESPRVANKNLASVEAAESNALALDDGVVLRFAQFYSADSHHTVDQLRAARRGVAATPGDPAGYWSLVHADDVATAVVAALDAAPGVYNVAEDDPMTRRDAAQLIAGLLHKKKLRHVLSPITYLGMSARVSNKKFKGATSWSPQVPSQREGWPLILKELGDE